MRDYSVSTDFNNYTTADVLNSSLSQPYCRMYSMMNVTNGFSDADIKKQTDTGYQVGTFSQIKL